ncbi:hypothetical protein QE364_001105 [Nocardioides zeae]|uniref:(2Fe-2S) ferredoxin domain-containing protein n=2 Tax=Nocardioides zeae TaxID=1457234 RepID=A0AAJ1X2U4_9ACTN|nr:hypothetical protein [Nocardioides zeae]MDQ1103912.1 hypothetical protein [Nocardioides zeae]MDR6176392.1 hypothetical protein [Nocardioides zeae]MDR6209405.1 hypothetical protein [Nocardioides zeae]
MTPPVRPDHDVLVCHDCCCGTARKHPGVDHDDLVQHLRDTVPAGTRVRVVRCLGECERSNVVVVRDLSTPGRPRDTWHGGVLDRAAVDRIVAPLSEPRATGHNI